MRAALRSSGLKLVEIEFRRIRCGARSPRWRTSPMRSAAGTAAVQLNDGPLADADFLKHARAQRKMPGEGELDVVGLIRAVQATGFRAVLRRGEHPGIRALPVGEAARRAADACRRGAVHGVGVIVGRHLARSNGDSLIVRPASGSPPRQPRQGHCPASAHLRCTRRRGRSRRRQVEHAGGRERPSSAHGMGSSTGPNAWIEGALPCRPKNRITAIRAIRAISRRPVRVPAVRGSMPVRRS